LIKLQFNESPLGCQQFIVGGNPGSRHLSEQRKNSANQRELFVWPWKPYDVMSCGSDYLSWLQFPKDRAINAY
jgi:hypothetical protein